MAKESSGHEISVVNTDIPTGGGSFWTPVISGSTAEFRFESTDVVDGAQICLVAVNVPKEDYKIKSFIDGSDQREDLVKSYGLDSRYHQYGKPITLIRFQDSEDGTETNCTGVFVARDLVATNNHCIDEKTNLRTVTVTRMHETLSTNEITAHVLKIEATDKNLDYSLLRVDFPSSDIAELSLKDLQKNAKLILIQHPNGALKQIAALKCRVQTPRTKERKTDFYHLCDTSGGSSGSPLMDEKTGVVYGLHHLGEVDKSRNDFHNLAIYISDILTDLDHKNHQAFVEVSRQVIP